MSDNQYEIKWITKPESERDRTFIEGLCSNVAMTCEYLKISDLTVRMCEFNKDTQKDSWQVDVLVQVQETSGNNTKHAVKYRQAYRAINRDSPEESYDGAFTVALSSRTSVMQLEYELLIKLVYAEYYKRIAGIYTEWTTHYKDSPVLIWT